MPFVTSNDGTRIHYEVRGEDGPWVVLINGLGVAGAHWGEVPGRLQADGPRRLLLVDNRGTGQSEIPTRPFKMRQMADDVASAMDDAGADEAVVVGISMGGMIAQELVLRHPARVRALLLLATTPGLPHALPPSPHTLRGLSRMPFALRDGKGRELLHDLFFRTRTLDEAAPYLDRLLEQYVPKEISRAAARAFFLQLGAVATHSTGFRLHLIDCPTHVVSGTDDAVIPPLNSYSLARRIPGATLEMLGGVGHALQEEHPELVAASVRRLLERTVVRAGLAAA